MGLKVWRLNVGCGCMHEPGYINLDVQHPAQLPANTAHPAPATKDPGPDFVQAHGCQLPLLNDSLFEVKCNQFLEHLTLEELLQFLLEVRRVLAPGGRFLATFPDVVIIAQACERGELHDVAEHWWPGSSPETQDLHVLQLAAYSVGHRLVLTGKLVAQLISRYLMVQSVGTSRTDAHVIALKPWW